MEAAPVTADPGRGPVTPGPGAPAIQLERRAKMEILLAILLGLFLSALDQTIVGTALPTIVSELEGSTLYSWAVTIYLLTSTVTGPIYGKLSDLFGRRLMFLSGIGLFLLGSFLCGLAGSMEQLIIFRGLQGVGAGAIFPVALAVIGDLFTPAERGKYQGLFGAVFGIAALIGPAAGGFLTERISWHWVFFVNLPLGAIVVFIVFRLLPNHRRPDASRDIDYLGSAVFTAAIVPILIGLTNKQTGAWTDPAVGGLILLGLAVGAVFLGIESRAKEPIVPLGLFRNRTFSLSMIAVFLASFGFFGAVVFLPLWFQVVQGSSPTLSGYQMLPLLAGLILSATASGAMVSRTGRYKTLSVGALILVAVGTFFLTNLHADTPLPLLWLWMFVTGLGIGPSFAVFTIIVQSAVPFDQLGVATGNLTLWRQIGGTVGLALAFSVFGTALQDEMPKRLVEAGVPQPFVAAFQGAGGGFGQDQLTDVGGDLGASILAGVPPEARAFVEPLLPAIVRGIHEAISTSIGLALWLGVFAALAAAVATVLMREVPLRQGFAPRAGARGEGESGEAQRPAFGAGLVE